MIPTPPHPHPHGGNGVMAPWEYPAKRHGEEGGEKSLQHQRGEASFYKAVVLKMRFSGTENPEGSVLTGYLDRSDLKR